MAIKKTKLLCVQRLRLVHERTSLLTLLVGYCRKPWRRHCAVSRDRTHFARTPWVCALAPRGFSGSFVTRVELRLVTGRLVRHGGHFAVQASVGWWLRFVGSVESSFSGRSQLQLVIVGATAAELQYVEVLPKGVVIVDRRYAGDGEPWTGELQEDRAALPGPHTAGPSVTVDLTSHGLDVNEVCLEIEWAPEDGRPTLPTVHLVHD